MTRLVQNRARALIVTTAVAVALAAGAFAYWMGTGSGSATAVLGSPEQLTLEAGGAQAQLAPGSTSNVAVIATNSNPYFVNIATLTLDTAAGTGGFDVDAGHSGCDLSVLHLATQNNGGAGWRVPPKLATTSGTLSFEMTNALSMDAGAANACQGASFTVHLVAGA
jgi:hypothetical protein